jgi:hypothetical protein
MYNPDNPNERFQPYGLISRSNGLSRDIKPHQIAPYIPPPPEWEDLKKYLGIKSKTIGKYK